MPKITVSVTDEEQKRMQSLIPWGIQAAIIRLLINRVLDLIEEHGDVVLGALLFGKLTVLDLLKRGKGE